jgi:[ribosomal protein S18]-alanine N-acetyltransferase
VPDFPEKITLRDMDEKDLDAVLAIESASFSRPWTKRHFQDEIISPCGRPTVAVLPDGALAGYLCLQLVLDEAEILDVAVAPALRGRGVGRQLVEGALSQSRRLGAALVFLEVRVGNAEAILLYRRLGFREIGRRKGYYDDGEDAILMEYTFSDQSEECDAV